MNRFLAAVLAVWAFAAHASVVTVPFGGTGADNAPDALTNLGAEPVAHFNVLANPDAESGASGWATYDDSGNTAPAVVTTQDITYTSALAGAAGNGATVTYGFHASQSYTTPLVTCPTGTSVSVVWYNGPTIAANPSATQLKAAYDATPCAVAIATAAITGTAAARQYESGTATLSAGGDTAPQDATGGSPAGTTFTSTGTSPLAGAASFHLVKDAANRQGSGVSADFHIANADKGKPFQITFAYSGSAAMTLGAGSDVQVYIYDTVNARLLTITPLRTIAGPVSTTKTYVGKCTSSATSADYRLVLHVATASASAWDLTLDTASVAQFPSANAAATVLAGQPISGAVTDHMAVAWTDGAGQWVPATSAYNGDYWGMFGIATNIVGATADVYLQGFLDGFNFGPFAGYNMYVDPATAGGLSPTQVPATDTYLIMGKAVSATALNIQVYLGYDLVTSKGGLLGNAGANNGTGDQVLAVGSNGNVLVANSGATLGFNWAPAVVATAPLVYTTSTRALTCTAATNSVAGCLSAADHTTYNAKAPAASPTFTGTVNLPAINLINAATNGTNTVLVLKNGHLKTTQTTAPTAAVNANAGTSATCALTAATDAAGKLALTTGSGSWASGTQCTVTFNAAYGTAPVCTFSPAGANAAANAASLKINFPAASTTTFTVNFGTADSAGTAYNWAYACAETQ